MDIKLLTEAHHIKSKKKERKKKTKDRIFPLNQIKFFHPIPTITTMNVRK